MSDLDQMLKKMAETEFEIQDLRNEIESLEATNKELTMELESLKKQLADGEPG